MYYLTKIVLIVLLLSSMQHSFIKKEKYAFTGFTSNVDMALNFKEYKVTTPITFNAKSFSNAVLSYEDGVNYVDVFNNAAQLDKCNINMF